MILHKRASALNLLASQASAASSSGLLRGTLILNAALNLAGAVLLATAAFDFAARGETPDFAIFLLLAGVLMAAAIFTGSLAARPRYQPIALVMVINAASGLAAFMLVAAGQIEPVLAGLAGLLLLSLAGLLFLELRKVRL